jgi:GMP synthase-like glutamine amidotransferase
MSRVLFIQNGEHDHPGLLGRVVEESGFAMDVIHAWDGEPVPTVANGWRGIVIGGGLMSAYETAQYPFLVDEMRLVNATRDAKRPLLGLCLGAQIMSAALGGKVSANATKEIGFQDVKFTPEAAEDPVWNEVPTVINPVHWHGDVFSLPAGAVRLASSDITPNQLMRIGTNMYGVQFHLEIDYPVLRAMVETDEGWLEAHGVDPDAFLEDAEKMIPQLEPIARGVLRRWIDTLQ